MLRGLKNKKIKRPYMIVVTDLVSTHAAWFTNDADLVIVPTEQAATRARLVNLRKEKLRVIGLPVSDRISQPVGDRDAIRSKLNWPNNKPVVLLVGGGEGMGPLDKVAFAVDNEKLPCSIIVVAGHNKRMLNRLNKHKWNHPPLIYGFVREMPEFMHAADILITKAGPGTISEAFIAGLPIILYHRIPGQEEGNVSYVVDQGAGVWAPEIEDIIATLKDWLTSPEKRKRAADISLQLARPNASRDIAKQIAQLIGIPN
jgi:1,2-diacylglycerol 3-beta-galactosyltransferase